MKEYTGIEILRLPMQLNDAGAKTIGEYLVKLGAEVWKHGEGFSGKRPFGNSCWEHEVYSALVRAEAIEGHFDNDGYLEDSDDPAGNTLIDRAFEALLSHVAYRPGEMMRLIVRGAWAEDVLVEREAYEKAKREGSLIGVVGIPVCDRDLEVLVTEPDGTELDYR